MGLRYCIPLAVLFSLGPTASRAQSFHLPADLSDSTALAREMPILARRILEAYRDPDRERELNARFRLEIVAGLYADAARSVGELRALRTRLRPSAQSAAADAQYEIWARAMAANAVTGQPFDQAFADEFRTYFRGFDDRTAALAIQALSFNPRNLDSALRGAIAQQRDKPDIRLTDAVVLVRAYQRALTHAGFRPLIGPLVDEDDERRYVTQRNVTMRTPDGATVCALIVRPRVATRLPALLTFTIYVDSAANVADARRAAANSYVGVIGFTRGKACSSDAPVPYRFDGRDAAALIDWMAAQPWSDGQVGMYGGSYSGFTTWAAAKHAPRALKAIMVGAPVGPGIDVPMEGNIGWNFIYPWPFYTTNNKTLDNATYFDNARWFRLNREWYVSGKAYRDFPLIDGTPNPVFSDWIAHPSYDAFWQGMIPYQKEFAKVKIPVLQTAGYYYGGPGAALYYFDQHYAYAPDAKHYLLIGPYDHVPAQRGVVDALGDTATMIAGYETDPAARIDIVADLRYQWFDWVLRAGPPPYLLENRVNYQVMGLNIWKHAPSIDAMSNATLRLYLTSASPGATNRLTPTMVSSGSAATLRVDLANRVDIDSMFAGGGVRDTTVNSYEALTFVSGPLDDIELSGLYSGRLSFTTNKKDFDLSIALFELTTRGEYVQLPPLQIRMSYARDLTTRHLLTPGARQTLDFRAIRLMSRKFEPRSRLVMVIGPLKNPGQQINYGSGKPVSEETIADAGAPLEIRWFGNSFIDLPIRR